MPFETRSDATVSFHDRLATKWEAKYKAVRFLERLRILSELLTEQQIGKQWLDAGCGTGTVARWLAKERGASVTAVDASEQMLANAHILPGVTYIRADVTHTGLPEGMFDGIVCSSVIEYLVNPEIALCEFLRLLKPRGILLISVPHAAPLVRIPLKTAYWLTLPFGKHRLYEFLDYSIHSYTTAGISQLLYNVGFASIYVVDFARIDLLFGLGSYCPGALLMSRAIKR